MISIIDDTGHERFLGNNEPPAGIVKAWPVYGDTAETNLIPRSKWPELIAALGGSSDHPFLPPVHDQDGIGQCNCDATASMAESQRLRQGLPLVKLSAADLYARINGGADNGSLLEDAMHEMLTEGIGTVETCGTLWHRGMKLASAAERARFKALEVFTCPTFDHQMSAALEGCGLVSGIMWYPNYKPDGDGWLPRGRGSPGGHAVFGYKPAMRGNEFGIWHLNSWSAGWGINGRCVFPESSYGREIGGLWAIRSITDEGGVIPAAA